MRSRPTAEVADRMFTWWSDNTVATSESSRVRSSASTWIATTNDVGLPVRQETSISRSGCARERLRVRAVGAVDADALAARDEAHDLVAGHRRAAASEPHPHVGRARDHDARGDVLLEVEPVARAGPPSTSSSVVPCTSRERRATTDCGDTCPSPTATKSASRLGNFISFASCGSASSVASRLNGTFCLRIRRCSGVAALLEGVLAPLPAEPLADLVARPRRRDEPEPVLRRALALRLRGEDVDRVAGAQLVVEGHELAVHLGADRAVPDLGVDRVGEVDRRRAGRQVHHVALRREARRPGRRTGRS